MEIILSTCCKSISGLLNKKYGYYIQCRGGRFFSARKSKGDVPPEGHWQFIVGCAQMSNGLMIANIRVGGGEMQAALVEAGERVSARCIDAGYVYNAEEVLWFKNIRGL